MAQLVKNPPAVQETWVQSLGWEDHLEKGKATLQYSGLENTKDSIVHGVTKSQTQLSDFHFHFRESCGRKQRGITEPLDESERMKKLA